MEKLLIDVRKSPPWKLEGEVQQLCRPFFEKYGLNYLDYAQFYPDRRVVSLVTNRHYGNYFINHDVYYTVVPARVLTPGFHLWTSYIDLSFLQYVSAHFQHDHGITIITEMNDYTEVMNFAAPPQNRKILDFYLNQQPILQKLMTYFRKKASKLIYKSMDNPIILPDKKIILSPMDEKLSRNYFPTVIQVNNISVPLTTRETECLYYLNQGKTAKEIGKLLDISNRTVEFYLDQLRTKTNSKSRLELLSKLNGNQLEKLITIK